VEEAQVEQPQAEEARAEQPPAEEPRAEQPPAEEPQVEQPDLHLAPEASGPGEARQLGDREDQASGAVPVEAASPHAVQAAGEVASAAVDAPAHGSGSRAADGPPDTALPAPGGPPATTAAAPTGAPHTPAGGTGNGTASDTGSDTASDTAAGITPAVDSGVDSGVDSDAGGQRRRGWRQLLPLAVLGLVLLLMLGLTGWLGWQLRQDAATETARTKGLTAARDAARVLFSYDYQQLDKDFAAGLAVTTGSARDEYQRTTSSLVRPVAVQYQAVVKADVREAGVIEASPGHVLTMIFLNQTTTSTRVQGPKIDQNRVRLGLRLVGGKWLVDRVEGPL
jgi:Mce-associated membrane protein